MNNIAKQKALNYIMYMILGSYFDKTISQTPLREKQLFLYYKDLKGTEQIDLEAQCIRYVEKFKKAVPEEFWGQTMKVSFQGTEGTLIKMQGENHIMYITTSYDKKKPKFHIQLLTKVTDRPLVKAA